MIQQEKTKQIVDRLKEKGIEFDPEYIPVMVIINYLTKLTKLGMIDSEYTIPQRGQDVIALCEEFDWKPDNDNINAFVNEMIDPQSRPIFTVMLRQYRDDREGLIADFEKFKKEEKQQ